MEVIKTILSFLFAALVVIVGVVLSYFVGYLLQWVVWLIFAIYELFLGGNAFTHWVANNDNIVHIICSVISFFLLAAGFADNGGHNRVVQSSNTEKDTENNFNYFDEAADMKRRNFSFVDCSGAYRKWGDTFIDHKGNYCRWGTGFYDYDDNYIYWGGTYKDCSGAYRHWGDDFIDVAGNYVNIP